MKLHYNPKTRNFILASGAEPDDANWIQFAESFYKTKCYRTAAQFKQYADKDAKEAFKNAKPILYPESKIALPSILDEHQVEGVHWILSRKYSYLSHAPGAGKTAQSIIASELCLRDIGAVVVIVPPTLTANWEREIDKFTKEFRAVTIIPTTNKKERVAWNADYIIVPNSMLTKDWVLEGLASVKTKVLIVDEASAFKESTTARSQTLYEKILPRDWRHVIFLDGSPAPNRAMELYAPLINLAPESIRFMNEYQFGFKYGAPKQGFRGKWEFKGWSNEAVLQKKIHRYLFHTVTEDKLNHPERLRSIVYINDKNLSAKIKKWERAALKDIKLSDLSDDSSKGAIAEWRHKVGLAKIKQSAQYIKEKLDKGKDHIIVFAWHREVVQALASTLGKYKPIVVMGGTKSKEREKYFELFNKGKYRLIIGNIAALSRGHNLQRGDRNIFVEYSWSDEVNKQCEKRSSRKGRDASHAVRSDYIVLADTLDEIVLNTAMRRERAIKKVIK